MINTAKELNRYVLSFVSEQKVTVLWKDKFNIVNKINRKLAPNCMVSENCTMKCLDGKNVSGPHVHLKILVGK